MKVLICGGRDFDNLHFLFEKMDEIEGITHVIHGGARGADSQGGEWAYVNQLPCTVYPANWGKYGRKAGPLRNIQMLEEGKPNLVIAFPGGTGTAHMVRIVKEAGVPVKEVKYE